MFLFTNLREHRGGRYVISTLDRVPSEGHLGDIFEVSCSLIHLPGSSHLVVFDYVCLLVTCPLPPTLFSQIP